MATRKDVKLTVREIALFGIALLALFALFGSNGTRTPFNSSELKFTEFSQGGMHIMPASCPSNPHFAGECSVEYAQSTYYSQSTYEGYGQSSYNSYSQASYNGVECELGQLYIDDECRWPEPGEQCTEGYFCQGSTQYHRTAQCDVSPVQDCPFGCSGGGCLAPPPGSGNITVRPALIRSGEQTTVSWATSDMIEGSCYVVENNPSINDTGAGESNSFLSSPLNQQTSYSLFCQKLDETTFTDSATVNIIPIWEEPRR